MSQCNTYMLALFCLPEGGLSLLSLLLSILGCMDAQEVLAYLTTNPNCMLIVSHL